jgi:hypothetical protein
LREQLIAKDVQIKDLTERPRETTISSPDYRKCYRRCSAAGRAEVRRLQERQLKKLFHKYLDLSINRCIVAA